MSCNQYKEQAARLSEHLAVTHGVKLKHHAALNAVAALYGARNWNTLIAQGSNSTSATKQDVGATELESAAQRESPTSQHLLERWSGAPAQHPVFQRMVEQRSARLESLTAKDSPPASFHPGRLVGGVLGLTSEDALAFIEVHRKQGSSVAILGAPGSGKTFLLQELIFDTLRRNGSVHALTVGPELATECGLLGGCHVELTCNHPRGLNPFSACPEDAFEGTLRPLLTQLLIEVLAAGSKSPHWSEAGLQQEVEAALQSTWAHSGGDASFEEVLELLTKSAHPDVADASRAALNNWEQLAPWTVQPDPQMRAALKQPFVVFEVEGLLKHPEELRLVARLVAVHSALYASTLPRDVPRLFAINEADSLLRENGIDGFWQKTQALMHTQGGGIAFTAQHSNFGEERRTTAGALAATSPTILFTSHHSVARAEVVARTPWARVPFLADAVRNLKGPSPAGAEFVAYQQEGALMASRLELDAFSKLLLGTYPINIRDKQALRGTPQNISEGLLHMAETKYAFGHKP